MARPRPIRQRPRRTLYLEVLEARHQPSVLIPADDVGDTLPAALDLAPALVSELRVESAIGDNAAGGADVDWYRFQLNEPSNLTLTLSGGGVLSLYNDDPFSLDRTVAPLHRRMLDQTSAGANGLGVLSGMLAPGTYF